MAKDRRSMTIDEIMAMNKVDARASLPPGFPPPPPPIGDFKGKNEDEYKEYMRQKLQREQWENSLTLYRMREREGDKAGMQNVVSRVRTMFDVAAMPVGQELDPNSREAAALDSILEEEGIDMEEKSEEPGDMPVPENLRHLKKEPSGSAKKPEKRSTPSNDPFIPQLAPDDNNNGVAGAKLAMWCGPERRFVFFVPIQVVFLIVAIIATAVGLLATGIIFGIALSFLCAIFGSLIILPYRHSAARVPIIAFFIGEGIALVLCIIGGLIQNKNAIFYCGIPAAIGIVVATVFGHFFIIRRSTGEGIIE